MHTSPKHSSVLAVLILSTVMTFAVGCGETPSPEAEIPQLLDMTEPDRTAALEQRVCPVDAKYLGEEQTPLKVSVRGDSVFVCSPECEAALKKDPQRYLQVVKAAETE